MSHRNFACLTLLCACTAPADEPPEVLARLGAPACKLTEILPPAQLGASERGAFNSEGRFFAIGTRPAPAGDGASWLVEVVKATGGHAALNYVRGTLEGTRDGSLEGEPLGDACTFSGMASHGDLLYLGCFAEDGRASLLQVDTLAETVRAGAFTSCSFEPAKEPCEPIALYPNGMAVDGEGRVYASNTQTFIGPSYSDYSLVQIDVGACEAPKLDFTFRAWLDADLGRDGLAPNGIQIRDQTLYYAGGTNLNAVPIGEDGSAGEVKVYYRGPLVSMIDDFAILGDQFVIARALPSDLSRIDAPARSARELAACNMPALGMASSITRAPVEGTFEAGALLVTSWFGGGLYSLDRLP
ncbi:MAG: hypothetical protein ABW352_10750 [Polyangiales bacterium]